MSWGEKGEPSGLWGPLAVGMVLGFGLHYALRRVGEKDLSTGVWQRPEGGAKLPFCFNRDVRDGFVGAIGGSPLIYLRSLSEETGCHIFVSKDGRLGGGTGH